MISPDERNDRVRMILAFRKPILDRHKRIETRIAELRVLARGSFHGGIYDEDEKQQEQKKIDDEYAGLLAQKAEIEWTWRLVRDVFGANDVELALTEAFGAIGNLPFVA